MTDIMGDAFLKRLGHAMNDNAKLATYPAAILRFNTVAQEVAAQNITAAEKVAAFSDAAKAILHYDDRVEPARKPNLSKPLADKRYRKELNDYIEKIFLYHNAMDCFIRSANPDFFAKNDAMQKTRKIDERFMVEFGAYNRCVLNYLFDANRVYQLNLKRPALALE